MPVFIVVGHGATTDRTFHLNDLAGATGRLDVLLRCVNSAFMLSNDIRRDVDLYLLLLGPPKPPKVLRFNGLRLKHLNPDERSTASLIRRALGQTVGRAEIESSPGVYVSRRGLAGILEDNRGSRIIVLGEDGQDADELVFDKNDVIVLGGYEDLTLEEETLLSAMLNTRRVCLGPRSLHAHHCITLVLNRLDRRL
jgi:tRNA (pseudouridine54-N1)-methyltransferase